MDSEVTAVAEEVPNETAEETVEKTGDDVTAEQQEVTPEETEGEQTEAPEEAVVQVDDQNQNNANEEEQPTTEGEGETPGGEQTEGQEGQVNPVSEEPEAQTEEGVPKPGDGAEHNTPQPEDQSSAVAAGEAGEQGEAEAGDNQEKGETEEAKSGEQEEGGEEAQADTGDKTPNETGDEPTPDSAGGEESTAEGELAAASETPGDEEQTPDGDKQTPDGEQQTPDGEQQTPDVANTPPNGEETPGDGEQTTLQSDTFAEGERPESPLAVGEKLSREGSPTEELDDMQPEVLEPGTPDQVSEAGEEMTPQELMDIEEDEVQPEIDRAQLIERYHAAISERDQLQQQNYQLQHKTAEYFRKKKSDESRQDFDKNVSDQEQRYIKYMANLEELRKQEGQETDHYEAQIEELKDRCLEKQERVEAERVRFAEFKKQVALNSINSRSGKTIPPKDIEQYLSTENRKDKDVVNVRLENIKLKNKLKKKEQQLKSKEELAEGLHLIDFEQLKIENQTYNEKIEERNEELLKLRKKITSTVQVLTHLKEKLQFVQAENQVQNMRLRDVESVAAQKRDILSRTKQARDALRIDNQKLRQNCGLLGNEPLLRDFEEQRDESDGLKMKLEKLRMQHAELTLNCNQVRRKIEQARMNQI